MNVDGLCKLLIKESMFFYLKSSFGKNCSTADYLNYKICFCLGLIL
jgi:hypothetical protein